MIHKIARTSRDGGTLRYVKVGCLRRGKTNSSSRHVVKVVVALEVGKVGMVKFSRVNLRERVTEYGKCLATGKRQNPLNTARRANNLLDVYIWLFG